MSSRPSPSKSNRATPPGVNSGTTKNPSGHGAGFSCNPTAPVISVNNPADAAGPQLDELGETEFTCAVSARGEFFFSSPRSHPIITIARQNSAQLDMLRNIFFPNRKQ